MLTQKIQDDLTASLKAKKTDRVETLRMLMADIKNAQIEKGSDLDDSEVLKILKKSVKKLRDAADMFKKGGRTDLAAENEAQEKIFAEFLPEEMSDEALRAAIDEVIAENQDLFDKNPNAVIGIAMKKLSDQADPQRIMKELKSR